MSPLGKTVSSHTYFHIASLEGWLEAEERDQVEAASRLNQIEPGRDFNVVKLERHRSSLSLLDYPDFFGIAFPVLCRAWTVDLGPGAVRFRTFADSLNPPILHRKELLLPADHPRRAEFEALTQAAEAIGLFDDPLRIGFQRPWEALLTQRGYRVVGHALVPIGNDEAGAADEDE